MRRCISSYGLERVMIACDHLTNMQGCHGNCTGELYVCADYHGLLTRGY